MSQPTRTRIEPGIYERVSANGERLGLEISYKDATGAKRRRAVNGGLQEARDALALARTRRVARKPEPVDPRVTFATVADAFDATHVAGLRKNSREAYRSSLHRLRAAFGDRRLTSITRVDVRALIASEKAEGLKANTINGHLSALSALYSFARDDLGMPVTMPRLKPSERPHAADDQREHRILTDDEITRVLEASRQPLFFRTLAETGARCSEVLGLLTRRVDSGEIAFREQLARGGALQPLKTRQSQRTIEITRSLAAELKLASRGQRVFALTHGTVERSWAATLAHARLADPQPVIHDLRHTHVSGLIADGWDPVEVAARIGDTLQTTLKVYAHEFDASRRSEERRGRLEARYGDGPRMATDRPQQSATDSAGQTAEVADLQAIRYRPR